MDVIRTAFPETIVLRFISLVKATAYARGCANRKMPIRVCVLFVVNSLRFEDVLACYISDLLFDTLSSDHEICHFICNKIRV